MSNTEQEIEKKDRNINPNQNQNRSKPNNNNANRKRRPTFDKLDISVVIPLLNEEESLPELAAKLEVELTNLVKNSYEVIFVDDGSTDNSFGVIKELNNSNKKFKAIRFRRNYGKSAALAVGFKRAKGEIVITMDADLQDDPSEIKNLVSKLKEGFDLVSGWKKTRHDPINKTLPSKFFNFVTSITSGIKLHDFNCGLKAYRKEVVKSLKVYGEMHRYMPALAHLDGFKVAEIPVKHHPRIYGKSKFGASRFVKGFLDLITVVFTNRFMKRPLHFFGAFGFLFAFVGLILDLYLTIEWALGNTALSNRPLALLGVALIIVGVQFISMGLIGEMIVKNSSNFENYSIKEQL